MGTPALPIAATVAISTHISNVGMVITAPLFCIKYTTVIKINDAQPFIFIVVQIGSTKRETVGCTLLFCSAQAIVTGNVPAEDFEKNATKSALDIFPAVRHGLMRLTSKTQ